jgi:hypothetical protein
VVIDAPHDLATLLIVEAVNGTFGFALGIPEESLEMLAALSCCSAPGARLRELRSMTVPAP